MKVSTCFATWAGLLGLVGLFVATTPGIFDALASAFMLGWEQIFVGIVVNKAVFWLCSFAWVMLANTLYLGGFLALWALSEDLSNEEAEARHPLLNVVFASAFGWIGLMLLIRPFAQPRVPTIKTIIDPDSSESQDIVEDIGNFRKITEDAHDALSAALVIILTFVVFPLFSLNKRRPTLFSNLLSRFRRTA